MVRGRPPPAPGPGRVVRGRLRVVRGPRCVALDAWPPAPEGGGVPTPIALGPWRVARVSRRAATRWRGGGFSPILDKYLPVKSELVSGY